MKYYDKMHYEEELDLLCRCIRANISIMLHKTIYEINSTLLLKTHFKPPSSVCNNFLLRSHVEFGCLLLLKYAFNSLFYAAKISISDVHIHLKKITYKPYPIVIVCLWSYIIYSGCCHVYFCCVVCSGWNSRYLWCYNRLSFLSCQVCIPSIIHFSKRIYFHFYLSIYTLGGRGRL